MGLALDTIVGSATNPSTTLTTVTAATGDSFTVRSADFSSQVMLYNVNRLGATLGVVEVKSPRLHDNLHGIRLRSPASSSRPLMGWDTEQRLYPQDLLTTQITGGGGEVDGAALFLYYQDLPGISGRFAAWDAVAPRIVNIVGNEVSTTTSGTAFAWADTALNATFDTLKANVDYAVLGYEVDTEVLSVGVKGPETGNLRAAGPGTVERIYTESWFQKNARESGRPFVPIINAANKATTFVCVSHSATSATVIVNLILAELHA